MLSLFSCLIGRAIGDGHLDRDAPCLLLPQEAQRGVHPSRVIKERCRLGLGPWHLALRIGYVEHKVQRPTQQLGQSPDRSGKAKRLETPHAQGVGVAYLDNVTLEKSSIIKGLYGKRPGRLRTLTKSAFSPPRANTGESRLSKVLDGYLAANPCPQTPY